MLLEVRDLVTEYRTERGPLRAVDGVSFDLERGETLGIVGESGSGKSALGRTIMNILPRSARTGAQSRVLFEGTPTRELSGRAAAHFWGKQVAMIFQDPLTSLNPVRRIGIQLTDPLRRHLGLSRADAHRRAVDLLEMVGIPDPARRVRQFPHELSGGMRQRVMIAIAVSCGPKLLIADEPTTALDATVQNGILGLLARLQAELEMAMILISHDLDVVAGRTHRTLVMYGGRVVEAGPTAVLFGEPEHPYTRALLAARPHPDRPSHERLQVVPGSPPDLVAPVVGCRFAARCPQVMERCRHEDPAFVDQGVPGHRVACFLPVSAAFASAPGDGDERAVTD